MMSKDADIIELPVTNSARRTRQCDQTGATVATVIDLKAHSQSRVFKDQVNQAERQSDNLSPGEVWEAISDHRVAVHYQPQYDMRSGKTVAAEALVRLIDDEGQLVYPDRFIDPVEQRDLIVPLGRAVIEHVCIDLAACRAAGLPIQRVAINLSAHQLVADTRLLSFVDQMLARHGLKHEDLEFELTERHSLRPDCEGHLVLNALAHRGSRIVIDDFGIGYSSVVYLAELPIAAFKLDRTLIARVLDDGPGRALVDSLLALAENMGLDVVAEGVETKAQSDYLDSAGCPFAQGSGYARPMPIDELRALVEEEYASTEHACRSD